MIILRREDKINLNPSGDFYSSVGNIRSKRKTYVSLSCDERYLKVSFHCENNPFVGENTFTKDNDSLYKQEVFEFFIAKGNIPINYLELEINPNNALFLGKIYNPSGEGVFRKH